MCIDDTGLNSRVHWELDLTYQGKELDLMF